MYFNNIYVVFLGCKLIEKISTRSWILFAKNLNYQIL